MTDGVKLVRANQYSLSIQQERDNLKAINNPIFQKEKETNRLRNLCHV